MAVKWFKNERSGQTFEIDEADERAIRRAKLAGAVETDAPEKPVAPGKAGKKLGVIAKTATPVVGAVVTPKNVGS